MAVTFPSAARVAVDRTHDHGHCCIYQRFLRRQPGAMGRDYKISVRVDDTGQILRPCFYSRSTDAYQRPEWEALPPFVTVPEYVLHEAGRIERTIKRQIKPAPAAAVLSGQIEEKMS